MWGMRDCRRVLRRPFGSAGSSSGRRRAGGIGRCHDLRLIRLFGLGVMLVVAPPPGARGRRAGCVRHRTRTGQRAGGAGDRSGRRPACGCKRRRRLHARRGRSGRERDGRGGNHSTPRRPDRNPGSPRKETPPSGHGAWGADGVRRIEQLRGPSLAPRPGPYGSQARVSEFCFIIGAGKRHQVLMQALGEERDDIAVLGRAGLGWVFRSSPPLAIEGADPIACLGREQGKMSILGIRIDDGQQHR